MKKNKRVRFIAVSILLMTTGQAVAGWFGADFSAEIYEGTGANLHQFGSMVVSNGRVRTAINRDNRTMVEIIDPKRGKAWLLDPATRKYMERDVPLDSGQSSQQESPCNALPREVSCQHLGTEAVNGRNSDKWQLQDNSRMQLLWLDTEHHFPVRVVNDGQLAMEMRFLGQDTYASRRVEKWQSRMSGPQGNVSMTQWYDPQLNIAIRQVGGDGQVRELREIHIGSQPENLFAVPADYQRQLPQPANN